MAYQIAFAPDAVEQLKRLDGAVQRKLLQRMEQEAEELRPGAQEGKKLRRIRVNDHRLVFLELHDAGQLLVLKAADRTELHRRFQDDDDTPAKEPRRAEPTPGASPEAPGEGERAGEPAQEPERTATAAPSEDSGEEEPAPAGETPASERVSPAPGDEEAPAGGGAPEAAASALHGPLAGEKAPQSPTAGGEVAKAGEAPDPEAGAGADEEADDRESTEP
jgi:mRNA-degrading endonuclease RelE of RelBE toxin-antitoxin system